MVFQICFKLCLHGYNEKVVPEVIVVLSSDYVVSYLAALTTEIVK